MMKTGKIKSSLKKLRENYQSGLLNKIAYIKQCHKHHGRLFEYCEFMKGTDIASIEITDQGVYMTTREAGIKMIISPVDERIAPVEILNLGETEKGEIKLWKNLLERNYGEAFTMIDIGANIGWNSMNMAKFFPKSRIYSFEPIPETYATLLVNLALNGLTNIKAIQVGFSDHDQFATFYYDQQLSANASLANLSQKKKIAKVKMKLVTLDKYCQQELIKPDFLKVDVEGAELFVLKGAEQIIAQAHPIIFAEMLRKWSKKFNYHPNEIIKFLDNLGYRCFILRKNRLIPFLIMTDSTQETNFFFLNPKYHTYEHH